MVIKRTIQKFTYRYSLFTF